MTLRQIQNAWYGVNGNEKSTLYSVSELFPSCSTTLSSSSTNWKLCTDGMRARPPNSNVYALMCEFQVGSLFRRTCTLLSLFWEWVCMIRWQCVESVGCSSVSVQNKSKCSTIIWVQSIGNSVIFEIIRDNDLWCDLRIRGIATFIFISSPVLEVLL